ncbi:NACHT domain-containing protein [Kitasatospora cinereorecta]|uniref:NACHT domain-containing protein n=1 Tax=Kitasatospora cinereorecta TaxID=285560 RepID=A0ABW0VB76_9ACTN
MPVHPGAQRIAAVRAGGQGSGYLLSARLLLTAAHVVRGGGPITATVHGGRGWIRCRELWRRQDDTHDLALLLAEDDLVRPDVAAGFEPLRLGRLSGLEPVHGCHATGFPDLERTGDRLESGQLWGTVAPGTHLLAGRYVLSAADTPPVGDAAVPWRGMSGAAVFFRGLLLGVVSAEVRPELWRHSRLELTAVAGSGLAEILTEQLGTAPPCLTVTEQDVADADFEARYARAVRADHGQLRIFGLDVSRAQSRPRDIDTAYLSLEAEATALRAEAPGPLRVEQALAGRRRILLRGQAGSGKSTLVQWLAVHAAAGTLGSDLAEWDHKVPFVLRLRSMYRLRNLSPRPAQFLEIDGSPLADAQPAGWAERVLRGGRALLLVDGLDEIPEDDRAEAEQWLAGLFRHYPDIRCLVTVRPSAVPADWLAHLAFDELALRPMNARDRRALVLRWHRAIASELGDGDEATCERRALDELQAALLHTLATSPDLAALTDSPLLCSMICTLHREWNGELPHRRMDLYEAALNMLLVRRDQQRKVIGVEGVELAKEEQLAVLQRIAYWLTVNRLSEGGRPDAVRLIERLHSSFSGAARAFSASQVFTHLLNRSGLLAETGPDTFQFIHRSFQDHLAALEFAEERSFGLLLSNAGDEQWADVVRMTVGHLPVRARPELLRGLLQEAHVSSRALSVRLHVLAGTCLPYATLLDENVREDVLRRLGRTLDGYAEGLGRQDWQQLRSIGPELIPHLPDTLPPRPPAVRENLVLLLGRIGGPAALHRLAAVAPEMLPVEAALLTELWSGFDRDEYARTVLARADLSEILLRVTDPQELFLLPAIGRIGMVYWCGEGRGIRTGSIAGLDTDRLMLNLDEDVEDLAVLAGCGPLDRLDLVDCSGLRDVSVLAGQTVRRIDWVPGETSVHGAFWRALTANRELRALRTDPRLIDAADPDLPQPTVEELTLTVGAGPVDLPDLGRLFPALRTLTLEIVADHADLSPLKPPPGVRVHLVLQPDVDRITGTDPLPSGWTLTVGVGE